MPSSPLLLCESSVSVREILDIKQIIFKISYFCADFTGITGNSETHLITTQNPKIFIKAVLTEPISMEGLYWHLSESYLRKTIIYRNSHYHKSKLIQFSGRTYNPVKTIKSNTERETSFHKVPAYFLIMRIVQIVNSDYNSSCHSRVF